MTGAALTRDTAKRDIIATLYGRAEPAAPALYLRKELRDHARSAGRDSAVGYFCVKCLVTWPCYSFRVADGRQRRTLAGIRALEAGGDMDAVVRAWLAASEATDWDYDDLLHFPPALLRTGVTHVGAGRRGHNISFGLRYGQEDYEW